MATMMQSLPIGVTRQEAIGRTMDHLVAEILDYQNAIDDMHESGNMVPAYVLETYESLISDASAYAEHRGFDLGNLLETDSEGTGVSLTLH